MPDPVAGARCNAILDPVDRKACELCRPDEEGIFRVETPNGTIPTTSRESCFKLVRTFSQLGIAITVPAEATPAPQPQPQPQPQSSDQSWGSLLSLPQEQEEGLHGYSRPPVGSSWTGWNPEAGQGTAPAPGAVTHPFVTQLIPDGRNMHAERTLLMQDSRGIKVEVDYATRPSDTPGVYILTYSIKRDGVAVGANSELKFRANSGKANLAFEVVSAPSDSNGEWSVRIVDLMK